MSTGDLDPTAALNTATKHVRLQKVPAYPGVKEWTQPLFLLVHLEPLSLLASPEKTVKDNSEGIGRHCSLEPV